MNSDFNIGDKVSFIDQKIDGTVKAVKSNGRLLIETDDGFDITVSPSEVILIQPASEAVEELSAENLSAPPPGNVRGELTAITQKNTLSFVTEAYEENRVLSGRLRYVLVNNLSSAVFFNAYKLDPEPHLLREGRITSGSSAVISDATREEAADSKGIYIQYLVCSPDQMITPGKIKLTPKVPGLEDAVSGEGNTTVFCTHKILYTHLSDEEYDLSLLIEKYRKATDISSSGSGSRKSSQNQHDRTSYDMVVDLHIEELTDDLTGLTPASMLEIQRLELVRKLNEFLRSGSYKLVVIHGVGKGILKRTVYEEVAKYNDLKCSPADPSLYGSGATEILFK